MSILHVELFNGNGKLSYQISKKKNIVNLLANITQQLILSFSHFLANDTVKA